MKRLLRRVAGIVLAAALAAAVFAAVPARKTEAAASVSNGCYTFVSALASNKVMDCKSGGVVNKTNIQLFQTNKVMDCKSGGVVNKTNIQLFQSNDGLAQKFNVTSTGDGWYKILSAKSGLAIEVAGPTGASGSNVRLYKYTGNAGQKWRFISAGHGYYYVQNMRGNYLAVKDGRSANGTNIRVHSKNTTNALKWKLKLVNINKQTTSKSVSSKRVSAVNYMRRMGTIKWTPKTTITYWRGVYKWYKGTTYSGIPYSQWTRNTTLGKFEYYLSGRTYVGPASQRKYLGSDCSSACSMAYRKVRSSFPILTTYYMFPVKGYCKAVGSYKHYSHSAYKQLKPGDLVLYGVGTTGHVRMVSAVGSGYVKCIEQSGLVPANKTSWKVDKTYTYAQLYSSNYIPVTMKNW